MANLSIFDYNSQGIRFETRDGVIWVSLTDMAKASGKKVSHWNQLDSTKEFLKAMESIAGFPAMVSKTGGSKESTGTWAIKEVAIDFAIWCNVHFRIWVSQQIDALMTTGKVDLDPDQGVGHYTTIKLDPLDFRRKSISTPVIAFSPDRLTKLKQLVDVMEVQLQSGEIKFFDDERQALEKSLNYCVVMQPKDDPIDLFIEDRIRINNDRNDGLNDARLIHDFCDYIGTHRYQNLGTLTQLIADKIALKCAIGKSPIKWLFADERRYDHINGKRLRCLRGLEFIYGRCDKSRPFLGDRIDS